MLTKDKINKINRFKMSYREKKRRCIKQNSFRSATVVCSEIRVQAKSTHTLPWTSTSLCYRSPAQGRERNIPTTDLSAISGHQYRTGIEKRTKHLVIFTLLLIEL
jgi:hypothetical protein